MSNATQRITAEEFWLLPEGAVRRELVRGQVTESSLLGARSGLISSACGMYLHLWAAPHDRGEVSARAGFTLFHHPDTVRAPAISYIQHDRIPINGIPEGFWEIAPDLAVEIITPTDLAEDMHDKIRDFLNAGTRLFWVVYPHSREVVAHTPDGLARTFRSDALLTNPDVLPGFSLMVKELFE